MLEFKSFKNINFTKDIEIIRLEQWSKRKLKTPHPPPSRSRRSLTRPPLSFPTKVHLTHSIHFSKNYRCQEFKFPLHLKSKQLWTSTLLYSIYLYIRPSHAFANVIQVNTCSLIFTLKFNLDCITREFK